MISLATYRPFEGGWRVVVVEEADRMNEAAQTHFLKTLEEPPSATMFVLVSEFPRRLLPAIRSRCQHIRFGALHTQTVKELLLAQRKEPELVAEATLALRLESTVEELIRTIHAHPTMAEAVGEAAAICGWMCLGLEVG